MTSKSQKDDIRILILNPNSSKSMTEGMEKSISSLNLPDNIKFDYYTAPSGPASINDEQDLNDSTIAVFNHLVGEDQYSRLKSNDAVLVCCFSEHPLVSKLSEEAAKNNIPLLSVTGIFEAATLASLSLLTGPRKTWGIVTTGKFWEDHLTIAVHEFLGYARGEEGYPKNWKFAGVQTTGLNAGDFHGNIPPEEIHAKMAEATKRLLGTSENVECVVMGCAGMAGLEQIIRRTAIEVYGEEKGKKVMVIDGVRAGVGLLAEMVKNRSMFTQ